MINKIKILIVEDQEAPLEALEDAIDTVMPKYSPDYSQQDRNVARCYNIDGRKWCILRVAARS